MYEKDGKYYTESEFINNLKAKNKNFSLYDENGNIVNDNYIFENFPDLKDEYSKYTLYEPGELVDFITNELSFNI
jgi:hypothetical protein